MRQRGITGKELLVVHAASASDLAPAINDARNRGAAALNVFIVRQCYISTAAFIIAVRAEAKIAGNLISGQKRPKKVVLLPWSEFCRYFPATRRNCRQSVARCQTR